MPSLNQKGIAHLLLPIILLLGIIVAVYLVTSGTLKLSPKAGTSKPIGPQTGFILQGPATCSSGWACLLSGKPQPKEEFEVKLYARSDVEEANLFTANMTFPENIVEVKEIKTNDSFVKNWVENYYDNETGKINLSGGVPSPGYKTQTGSEPALMATIVFSSKALGKGAVSFLDDSTIYSNLNNIDILTYKDSYDISVEIAPSPEPSSTPPVACKYTSTQARLQKDITDPWVAAKIVNAGEKLRVGGFHDGSGLLAPDVKLQVTGPKTCPEGFKPCTQIGIDPANGDSITTPDTTGMYTLTVTTLNGSGSACTDTATFQVQGKTSLKGDGNKDGKVNLIDMSVLHTDWNIDKDIKKTIRGGIDMNSDGLINAADFSALRNLLIELKVIRVK